MRYLLFFIPLIFAVFSCVKRPSEDPVPVLEFKDMQMKKITTVSGGTRDTAVLALGYSDGDGDIFRDNADDGANLVFSTYAFNQDSNKFIIDAFPYAYVIPQPAEGYYVGKSIHGDIFVPMNQFRSSDNIDLVKFEAFMVDMKGHKSNVVVSPVYTLNF